MPLSLSLRDLRDALAAAEPGATHDATKRLCSPLSNAFDGARGIGWIVARPEQRPSGMVCCYRLTDAGREMLALLRGAG